MGNSSTNDWAANADHPLITNAILKVGWLIKKGATRNSWNKRYVLLLTTNILLYFTDSNCLEHRGTADFSKLKNVGTINKAASTFIIVTANRTWEFKASNKVDAMDWVKKIKHVYNQHRHNNKNKKHHHDLQQLEKQKSKQKDTKSTFEYEMNMVKTGLMGWLTKKGELRRNWNSRWSILLPSRLMIYFSDETCENFKGCADFRESKLMLLFDDQRKNYFFIQTHMRIWEFSCKNSQQVKQWSTILQYLIDMDHKVLILKSADEDIEYPSKALLKDHFRSNGTILEVIFIKRDKIYVIIFEQATAIQQLMLQNRLHMISESINAVLNRPSPSDSNMSNGSYSSTPPIPATPDKYRKRPFRSRRHRSSVKQYELFALKFSEYMGNVHSSFGTDQYEFSAQKSFKSKVHGMAAARRFSSKSIINSNMADLKTHKKAKSLSFRDKYSQSAINEIKRLYVQHNSDDDDDEKDDDLKQGGTTFNRKKLSTIDSVAAEDDNNERYEWADSDDGYYDDTSSEDGKNGNVRMTSVADRGLQTYYDPNQVKTYKQSAIFNFSSPEKKAASPPPIKRSLEKMKSLPTLPSLQQCDCEDYDDNEEEKQQTLVRKKSDKVPVSVSVSKIKQEMAQSPILNTIVSKPKYKVGDKERNIDVFLEHMDKRVGLANFARFVAINDGNIDAVEQVYRDYRKKSMSGAALKRIESEERQMVQKEQEIKKQQQEDIYLNLKKRQKSANKSEEEVECEQDEEVEYDYEEIEIDEGCPIIIDNGGGFIKAAFQVSEQPVLIPNQCVESKENERKYVLFGDDYGLRHDTMADIGDIIFPIKRDVIQDWDAMNAIWEYTVLKKLGVDEMYEYPIMITEAPGTDKTSREKQLQHFMETHSLQKFYMMNTALANFYYTGKTRDDYCVIVDCGHSTTNISCIYMGMYLNKYASTIQYAGKDITSHLSALLRETEASSMYFHLDTSYKIANKIKHDYCYVARDFYTAKHNLVNKRYTLPDGRTLQIENEQYEAAEILFNPSDPKHSKRKNRGSRNKSSKKSMHSILINCVNKIDDDDVEKNMYANIYCCGGSVKLTNFTSRLQSELTSSLARRMSIVAPQHIRNGVIVKKVNEPQLSAWKGCAIISSLSSFNDKWITAAEYNEYGPSILLKKCTHQDL